MPPVVTSGAVLMCTMGTAPTPITAVPEGPLVNAAGPVATVNDIIPFVNIAGFAVCHSPANPACLNPSGQGPCTPVIPAPWTPGSVTTKIAGIPVLTTDSVCVCSFGGEISVASPAQVAVQAT